MADISKISLGGIVYDLKDTVARQMINNLPSPMVFKGSLGDGGTVIDLPTASTSTIGFTYKVITDGVYAGLNAKAGDTFICDDVPEWVLIPSGDEPSGTVTSITAGNGLTGGVITTSGTVAVDFSSVQPKLVAGDNISIDRNTNTISAIGNDLDLSIVNGQLCVTYIEEE